MMIKSDKDKLISKIYRDYNDGLITLEQREELIERVNDKYITENMSDITFSINTELLDKIEIFKERVYEKYANGLITLEQREELIEKFRNDFIMEKATREQYRLSVFKKKYKYDPKNKTIIVDGEKYYVDLESNNSIISVKKLNGDKILEIRKTSALLNEKDPIIILDSDFFKLSKSERRDAALKHEIGHLKSNARVDNGRINPELVKLNFDAYLNNEVEIEIRKFPDLANNKKEVREYLKEEYIKNGITPSSYNFDDAQKCRQKIIKHVRTYMNNKYISKRKNKHTNHLELEADRYAVDHSSEKALKGCLREAHKYSKSDKSIKKNIDNSNKLLVFKNMEPETKEKYDKANKKERKQIIQKIKNDIRSYEDLEVDEGLIKNEDRGILNKDKNTVNKMRKNNNKSSIDDHNIRLKALKDKTIRDNAIYKKKK